MGVQMRRRLLSGIMQASQQKNHHDAGHRSLVREAAPSHEGGDGGSAGRVQNAYAVDKEARDRGGGVLEEGLRKKKNQATRWLEELDNATRDFLRHETSITPYILAVEPLDVAS